MRELTPEEKAAADRVLAQVEAEIPSGMTSLQASQYLVEHGYAREMTEAEVKEYYGGYGVTTITFFGEPRLRIQRGDLVRVQAADGSWHNRLVAVRVDGNSVVVAEEGEWAAAQVEQREPATVTYPSDRVERAGEE